MRLTPIHYFPFTVPFALMLLLLLGLLVTLIQFQILVYAYEKLGVHPRYVLGIMIASFLGAAINIPVAELPPKTTVENRVVRLGGFEYVVPLTRTWPGTTIAVNVGGAIVPTVLSIYLIIRNQIFMRALIGTAIVALIVNRMATLVPGVGISVPTLAPPLIAAVVGLFCGGRCAAPLSYIAGCLGTLIGADLLNLGYLQGLDAPVASIGGAGTYDGIFVTGIIAVLLTWSPAPREELDESRATDSVESDRDLWID